MKIISSLFKILNLILINGEEEKLPFTAIESFPHSDFRTTPNFKIKNCIYKQKKKEEKVDSSRLPGPSEVGQVENYALGEADLGSRVVAGPVGEARDERRAEEVRQLLAVDAALPLEQKTSIRNFSREKIPLESHYFPMNARRH